MTLAPRVVFGVPAFDNAKHLPEALESLLSQTFRDFAIVISDDSTSDEPAEIIRRYAQRDARIVYRRNHRRLGMAANWRTVFQLARDTFPSMEMFAWGSDHDVWHPRWLAELVAALDADPDAVLAYPHNYRIDGQGRVMRTPWSFETRGVGSASRRLELAVKHMSAGNMVYGLARADALAAAGVFRPVLAPDRLLLTELAVRGSYVQVDGVLWYRRFAKTVSNDRQRETLFAGRPPLHAYLPWWLVHSGVIAWTVAITRSTAPATGRSRSVAIALRHAQLSAQRATRSRAVRIARQVRRRLTR